MCGCTLWHTFWSLKPTKIFLEGIAINLNDIIHGCYKHKIHDVPSNTHNTKISVLVSKYTLSWRMYLMFNLFTTPQIFRSVHLPSHWGCWGCPHGPPRWISRSHPFPWSEFNSTYFTNKNWQYCLKTLKED